MNPCCEKPENLEQQASLRPDITVLKCKVCNCRHFELSVDPAVIGVEVKSL